jgi:hypothetical protein
MENFFEGLEDRWTGGWPPLQTDLGYLGPRIGEKLEKVSKKKVVNFLWP